MRDTFPDVAGTLRPRSQPGVLAFYVEWATEMFTRWMRHGAADATSTMYMRTWVGALYACVDGWQELGLRDVVVDQLLALRTGGRVAATKKDPQRDELFVDLLRRARNDVFHYSGRHHPEKIAAFLDRAAHNPGRTTYGAFRTYFDKRERLATRAE